ncbi:MAG: hypothetical protein OXU20_16855 [Myxococcales bacterium]|nr:hypothetical protein [Myxococcales bacterium]MDD9965648.1 hypothetical protein [Myxococcales bacterium]
MGIFDQLAEARIQDWIRRGRPHPKEVADELQGATLEAQLLGEIIALRQGARAEQDPEARAHLFTQARSREVQLSVLLETSGRPLAAKALSERLQKI